MGTRSFSNQFMPPAPENRTIDNDAPSGMRLELIDSVFDLAAESQNPYGQDAVTETQLYRVMKHSMGLAQAPDNPMNGPRSGAVRQMGNIAWERVYDLLSRWLREFPEDVRADYIARVNTILAAHRVVWELQVDGSFHRVLPQAIQGPVYEAFAELTQPRFADALTLFRAAMEAYDERPQRSRDACRNSLDALEAVAKVVFDTPNGTMADALSAARQQAAIEQGTITALTKLYAVRNMYFGHGGPFPLRSAEVDFMVVSCTGGILLMIRL